ncbi:glutathione S-transferase N-terminal domain-containing protein [Suttonella ornithocola]|uniref:Putative glutathione S-transferase n=1 Tax=Suttonella ornithocola TaxID=279832 RepID=A0A380MVH6_9GAMM|nr:glutathione S-transferase family protein [Suttonella ornithocola]SUO96282.1 putative glutathione S-transferase [Suttonella ornithocola]
MKLYLSPGSPYARLVTITALRCGKTHLKLEFVNPWENPKSLEMVNPFSQVPNLVTDDGVSITNSLIICHYLDDSILRGSQAAKYASFALALMDQFLKYFSMIHRIGDAKQPIPHPHIARSLAALKRALPLSPQLSVESEDWSQYCLAVAFEFISREPELLKKYLSSQNQLAFKQFLEKPIMKKTSLESMPNYPKTLSDC